MKNRDKNPFESAASAALATSFRRRQPVWGWRLIPTVILGLLGSSSLSLGCYLLISVSRSLAADDDAKVPGWLYTGILLYLWTGFWWVFASWLCLRKHYLAVVLATAIGLAFPVGWELIVRIWPVVM